MKAAFSHGTHPCTTYPHTSKTTDNDAPACVARIQQSRHQVLLNAIKAKTVSQEHAKTQVQNSACHSCRYTSACYISFAAAYCQRSTTALPSIIRTTLQQHCSAALGARLNCCCCNFETRHIFHHKAPHQPQALHHHPPQSSVLLEAAYTGMQAQSTATMCPSTLQPL
jgi:hypothetical protein